MQLAVIKKDGEWSVLRDGAMLQSGASRSACIEAAEALAFDAEERGEAVELVIQDYLGHLKTRYSGASRA